ncbi:hypothetical protein ACJX0J_011354 [Zea mays]
MGYSLDVEKVQEMRSTERNKHHMKGGISIFIIFNPLTSKHILIEGIFWYMYGNVHVACLYSELLFVLLYGWTVFIIKLEEATEIFSVLILYYFYFTLSQLYIDNKRPKILYTVKKCKARTQQCSLIVLHINAAQVNAVLRGGQEGLEAQE